MDKAHGTTVGAIRDQNLAVHLPYSTGFGVGYRIRKYLDVRFEPKFHSFEINHEGSVPDPGPVARYKTVTLGVGAYFRWKPFEKQEHFLSGLFTSTSVRYWQNVWSSLDGNQVTYYNPSAGKEQIHKASNIGIANTPFLFNVAVGYSFRFY